MNDRVPIIRAQGEGDQRWFFGGGIHTWKLMTEDTDGAFFLLEDTMSRGKTTPLHLHPAADELVYLLDGEIRVYIDGQESRVGAGGMTFTPRGTPHAFLVISDTARLITLQTPGVGQAFYRGASEAATGDGSNTVDFARVAASATENGGIEILGPSPFDALKVG
jgi:quercetin dioxygenase-like cupin family protein